MRLTSESVFLRGLECLENEDNSEEAGAFCASWSPQMLLLLLLPDYLLAGC